MFLSYPSASYPETLGPALETHYPWLEKGFLSPGNGIIWFGLPNSEGLFQTAARRSCLPAGRVCSKLHASLCGFPNGPSQSPIHSSSNIFGSYFPEITSERAPRWRRRGAGTCAAFPSGRLRGICSRPPEESGS